MLAGHDPRIMEVVRLKWRDRLFRIRVSEEENVWVLDCLGSPKSEPPESEREKSENGDSGRGGDALHGDCGVDSLFKENMVNSKKSFVGNEEHDNVNMGPCMEEAACSHAFNVGGRAENKNENKANNSCGAKVIKRRKEKSASYSMGSPKEVRPKKRLIAQLEKEELFGMDDLFSKGPFPFQNLMEPREDTVGVSANGDFDASLDLNRMASLSVGQSSSEAEPAPVDMASNEVAVAGFNLVDEVVIERVKPKI
ncbi:hypothetical protein Hanom_Chr16g01463691 [Helianthus anomalus]